MSDIPIQSSQEFEPKPTRHTKMRTLLIVVVAIVAGFLLGIGSSSLLFNKQQNIALQPTVSPKTADKPLGSPVPEMQMKTFINNTYGYQFGYPEYLTVKSEKDLHYSTGWNSSYFVRNESSASATTKDVVLQVNNITKVRPGITVKNYFDELYTASPAAGTNSSRFKKVVNTTVDGKKAVEAYQDDVFGNQKDAFTSHTMYILKDPSLLVEVEVLIYKEQNKDQLENAFKSVISSFSFATPSATPTPVPSSPLSCTMEAKICPDGSTVGRQGPRCQFAPCPSTK